MENALYQQQIISTVLNILYFFHFERKKEEGKCSNGDYVHVIYFSYPVILSIENHCSVEQQRKMAECLKEILGGILFIPKTTNCKRESGYQNYFYHCTKMIVEGVRFW